MASTNITGWFSSIFGLAQQEGQGAPSALHPPFILQMVLQDTHLGCFSGFSSGALNSNQLPVETTWWCWLRTLKEQQQLPALSAQTSSLALYFSSAMYSSPTDISLPQMLLPCHNTQIPGSGLNACMSPFEGACPKTSLQPVYVNFSGEKLLPVSMGSCTHGQTDSCLEFRKN